MIDRIILIGGGPSIKEGIEKGLWEKIKDEFTIGMNSSMMRFNATIECFYDRDFYVDHLDRIIKLPLVVLKYDKKIHDETGWPFNTIVIPIVDMTGQYDDFKKGCGLYAPKLVGYIALSIAILMKPKSVYLLGFDWTQSPPGYKKGEDELPKTHWYQDEIEHHRGVGDTRFYDRVNSDKCFLPYANEPLNIYNVSMSSNINVFPKISYKEFFFHLSLPVRYIECKGNTQDGYREEVKRVLNEYLGDNILRKNEEARKICLAKMIGINYKTSKDIKIPFKHDPDIKPDDDVRTMIKKFQASIDFRKFDKEQKNGKQKRPESGK